MMMLKKYIYNISDDDCLNQKCRSFKNKKKLRFIMKIECYIWRIAVQINEFFFFESYELSSLQ